MDAPIEQPIDGTLDLHTFRPRDIGTLIPDYLDACREQNIFSVRIVHGKGTGTLRQGVHTLLDQLPQVAAYRLCAGHEGGWGATRVELHPRKPEPPA